jgi:hypothetical protein
VLNNPVWRVDRHGIKSLVTSDQTQQALAVLRAAMDRANAAERQELKARQDAGALNAQERLLKSVFGVIK